MLGQSGHLLSARHPGVLALRHRGLGGNRAGNRDSRRSRHRGRRAGCPRGSPASGSTGGCARRTATGCSGSARCVRGFSRRSRFGHRGFSPTRVRLRRLGRVITGHPLPVAVRHVRTGDPADRRLVRMQRVERRTAHGCTARQRPSTLRPAGRGHRRRQATGVPRPSRPASRAGRPCASSGLTGDERGVGQVAVPRGGL